MTEEGIVEVPVADLRVFIDEVAAVKNGILRVSVFTSSGDKSASYQLAILDKDFVTYSDGGAKAEIDIARFTQLVTKQILELRDTANLAMAITAADLSWTIKTGSNAVLVDDEVPESTQDGLSLAYGDVQE